MSAKEYNKELCEKYPFLIPRNDWSGKKITDCCGEDGEEGYWPGNPTEHPDYDYEYTLLDDMPDGWRIAFGEKMCDEIKEELLKHKGIIDEYYPTQIKEKYGTLRWYDNFTTNGIIDIVDYYEELSYHTCIECGKPATKISIGWVSPYCDECAKELESNGIMFKDIEGE